MSLSHVMTADQLMAPQKSVQDAERSTAQTTSTTSPIYATDVLESEIERLASQIEAVESLSKRMGNERAKSILSESGPILSELVSTRLKAVLHHFLDSELPLASPSTSQVEKAPRTVKVDRGTVSITGA